VRKARGASARQELNEEFCLVCVLCFAAEYSSRQGWRLEGSEVTVDGANCLSPPTSGVNCISTSIAAP